MSLTFLSILEELCLNCVKRVTGPFTESVLVEQPLPSLGSAGGQSDKIPPGSTSLCVVTPPHLDLPLLLLVEAGLLVTHLGLGHLSVCSLE